MNDIYIYFNEMILLFLYSRHTLDGRRQICCLFSLQMPCPLGCNCMRQVDNQRRYTIFILFFIFYSLFFIFYFLFFIKYFALSFAFFFCFYFFLIFLFFEIAYHFFYFFIQLVIYDNLLFYDMYIISIV